MILTGWKGYQIPREILTPPQKGEKWRLANSPFREIVEQHAHVVVGRVLRENLSEVVEVFYYKNWFSRGYATSEGEVASPRLIIFNSSTVISTKYDESETEPEVIAGFSWINGSVPTLLHPGEVAKNIGVEIDPYRIGWIQHFCTLMAEQFDIFANVKTIVR